jgi:23S rRNA pseudouridine2604 synthase
MNANDEGVRLAKRVAAEQGCSRREAEALIFAGAVQVNGQVVTDPARRVQNESVQVDRLAHHTATQALTIVAHQSADGPPLTLAALQALFRGQANPLWRPERLARVLAVVPLPQGASGLCVFSEDTGILRHLQDPRAPLEQEWLATVGGTVPPETLEKMQFPGFRVSLNHQNDAQAVLRIAGKAAQGSGFAQWLAEQLPLQELRRQRIGRLSLAPLAAGEWRALEPGERF